jgi:toxin ParE1/3/4
MCVPRRSLGTRKRNLVEIYDFIARENPEAAESFVQKLLLAAKSLETFPNRGGHLKGRPGIRFTVVDRYLIIYRVVETKHEVRILNFWHAAKEQRLFRADYKISG